MDIMEKLQAAKAAMLCLQRYQWEQGCAAQAILESEGVCDDVLRLCQAAVMRSSRDGRVGVMERGDNNISVDDPAAIGESLLRAYDKTGDKFYKEAADKLYFYLKHRAPKTPDGIVYHFNIKNQVWVDAYYMCPPFLCLYGDQEEAMKQIKGFRKYLFNEDAALLSHIWEDDLQEFDNEAFWATGNGWALAGMVRVIDMVEPGADKEYLIDYVKKLLDGCLKHQRSDGLFHDVLDDPSTFAESTASMMIAYSIYRGVMRGYLPKDYISAADKARDAVRCKVDELGYVRDAAAMPDFNSPGVSPEGQAFYILMETASKDYLASC